MLLPTDWMLNAYEDHLTRPSSVSVHGVSPFEIVEALAGLETDAEYVVVSPRSVAISRAPDDDRYPDCAVAGGADLIVMGDKDLLALGSHAGIASTTPAALVANLAAVDLGAEVP